MGFPWEASPITEISDVQSSETDQRAIQTEELLGRRGVGTGPKDPRKSGTSLTRWHIDRVGSSSLAAGPKAVQPRHGLSTSSIRVMFPALASFSNRSPSRMALSPGFSRARLLSAHSAGSRL